MRARPGDAGAMSGPVKGRSGPGVRASVRVGGRRLFHSPGDRRRAAARAGRTGVGTSRGPRRAT